MKDRAMLLTPDGDLNSPIVMIEGVDLVIQRLGMRLKTVLGSWPLDTAQGLPYLRWIEEGEVSDALKREVSDYFRKEIQTTPGVVAVRSLVVSTAERGMTISAEIDVVEDIDLYERRGFDVSLGDATLVLSSALDSRGLTALAILPFGA